jgi:hypothetical protein
MWWKNMKWRLIVGAGILIILAIIIGKSRWESLINVISLLPMDHGYTNAIVPPYYLGSIVQATKK